MATMEPEVLELIWKDPQTKEEYHVGNLHKDRFEYLDKKYLPVGFTGFPSLNIKEKIHTGNVLSVFLSRCMSKKRIDYPEYLKAYGLNPEQDISDFTLLAYTGVRMHDNPFYLRP